MAGLKQTGYQWHGNLSVDRFTAFLTRNRPSRFLAVRANPDAKRGPNHLKSS